MMILSATILFLLVSWLSPTNAQGDHPVCEVCGCSFCPDGLEMTNPDAEFTIPEEYRSNFFNLATVPCRTIDEFGQGGQVPPDLCSDELRLFEDFRTTCGCPIVSPPTTTPTDGPTPSPPTDGPTPSPPTDGPTPSPPTASPSTLTPVTSDPTMMPMDAPTPLPTLHHTSIPTVTGYPTLSIEKCQICGDGVSMRSSDAVYKIPKEWKDQFQGFDKVECKDLEDLASGGVFKEFAFVCSDEFRFRDDFRSTCGCDDDEEEPNLPTTCEICGCSKCDDGFQMSDRDAAFSLETPMTIPSDGLSPVSSVPCGLLEDVAFFGDMESGLSEYLCDDSFRLDTIFRETCGCPEIGKGKKNKEAKSREEEDDDDTPDDEDGDDGDDEKPDKDKEDKMNKRMKEDDDDHDDDENDHDEEMEDDDKKEKEEEEDEEDEEDDEDDDKDDKDDDDEEDDRGKKDRKGAMKRVRRKER